jgi:amino acid transporter
MHISFKKDYRKANKIFNILGLNISATFNSAVTIYILIPLLVIPQMILGGAMFN